MEQLALATNSTYVDESGTELPLYFSWYSGDLVNRLMSLVIRALGGASFDEIRVERQWDPHGLVRQITPDSIGPVSIQEFIEPRTFSIRLDGWHLSEPHWTLSPIQLALVSQSGVELATKTLVVAIPPNFD